MGGSPATKRRPPICYFFLGGTLTVKVTVVAGWDAAKAGVTIRPVFALIGIFLVATEITSFLGRSL